MRSDRDRSGITAWHYMIFLCVDSEVCDDKDCQYCPSGRKNCRCHKGLKVWWEAFELADLVVPSSGSSECVFSLIMNNLFGNKQSRVLSDALQPPLFLAFNKR